METKHIIKKSVYNIISVFGLIISSLNIFYWIKISFLKESNEKFENKNIWKKYFQKINFYLGCFYIILIIIVKLIMLI